jgi:hypothetical protein
MLQRALLVLLVVLNLGVAAWWLARPEPGDARVPDAPSGIPGLQLLSEVPPAALPEPEPVLCMRFGPYALDDPTLAIAREHLEPRVLSVRTIPEATGPASRWRVMLPPSVDEDAGALVERLVASGFDDVQPVRDGPEAGSVALGLFGGESAARAHRDRLVAAGFPAQVQGDGGERRWLVADLDAAQAVDVDVDALRAGARALQAAAVDCDAPMSGQAGTPPGPG